MKKDPSQTFQRLLDIMDELREKCPWDREQTFDSLKNNTIEETYELIDAITERDPDGIKGELGDLLLHIVFYSKIASEQGMFGINEVIDSICDKLIYRHPHVFGDNDADTPEKVKYNWEQLKLKEKKKKKGILGGVPVSLPAMVKAYRIGEKAAASGFDWQQKEEVWDKVREELAETEAEITAGNTVNMFEEFGDLLMAIVNAARLYGVDPEAALENSNRKFITRFKYIEDQLGAEGTTPGEVTLDELEKLWQQAKEHKNI